MIKPFSQWFRIVIIKGHVKWIKYRKQEAKIWARENMFQLRKSSDHKYYKRDKTILL